MADVHGIHLTVQPVDEGGLPTLPNGQQGVSRDQAIRAAMDTGLAGVDRARNLLPNVQVSAHYGLSTRGRPGMQLWPPLQNRPVWVITFSGPGVVFYGSAGRERWSQGFTRFSGALRVGTNGTGPFEAAFEVSNGRWGGAIFLRFTITR